MEKPANLDDLLAKQAELVDASAAAGKAVAKTVGDVSSAMYDKTGDPNWQEGGAYKVILQGAGAALVAQLGNGQGLDAALGAIASQLASGKISEVMDELFQGDPLLANMVQNILSSSVGLLVGGESGSNLASTMDRHNRQLHPIEILYLEDLAKEYAEQHGITEEDAFAILAQQALITTSEFWASGYEINESVQQFLDDHRGKPFFDPYTGKQYELFDGGEYFRNNVLFANYFPEYAEKYNNLPEIFQQNPLFAAVNECAWQLDNMRNEKPEDRIKTYDFMESLQSDLVKAMDNDPANEDYYRSALTQLGLAKVRMGFLLSDDPLTADRISYEQAAMDAFFAELLVGNGFSTTGNFGLGNQSNTGNVRNTSGTSITEKALESSPKTSGGATGFLGKKGYELTNTPSQQVRNQEIAIINGTTYSRHALDQMQNRGIMPSVVDNTVHNGVQFKTRTGTFGYYDPVNQIRVVMDQNTRKIITVMRGGPK